LNGNNIHNLGPEAAKTRRFKIMSITLSTNMRNTLTSLNTTQNLIAKSNERLSTGKRINSALDGAANFFTSKGLQTRADRLSVVRDGIGQGQKTLDSAQKAIQSMQTLIRSTSAELSAELRNQANARVSTVYSFANLNDSLSNNTLSSRDRLDTGESITISINGDGGSGSFTLNAASSAQAIILAINNTVAASALNDNTGSGNATRPRVRAYLSNGTSGQLVIEAVGSTSTNGTAITPTLRIANNGTANAAGSITQDITEVFSLAGDPNGTATLGTTALNATGSFIERTSANLTDKRQTLANNYKTLLNQIESLARDAGYGGVNLLQNDTLRVSFNEDDSTALTVTNSFIDRGSLRLTGETSGNGLTYTGTLLNDSVRGNFNSNAEIKNAIRNLTNADNSLTSTATRIAANQITLEVRKDFTESQVKTFGAGADDLVVADVNEEGANLLALQTRQQLSVQALSLAGQSEQAILRLF
jgi:flagellin